MQTFEWRVTGVALFLQSSFRSFAAEMEGEGVAHLSWNTNDRGGERGLLRLIETYPMSA